MKLGIYKMLRKYDNEFRQMYEAIKGGESSLKVIDERLSLFESEGIGVIGISYYLSKYIRKKSNI